MPTATDHFAVLGFPRAFRLDPEELERAFLERSRELHPDHRRASGGGAEEGVVAESAALNNAWRVLKDPFARAEHLVDLTDPGAMEREKRLPPDFLAEAMELAEEVAACTPEQAPELARRLDDGIAAFLDGIDRAFAEGGEGAPGRVAGLLHRSRYFRKARADLQEKLP